MDQRAHSRLGASKAARWLACPGSVALCATLPEPSTTEYARRGTAAHELAEEALHGRVQPRIMCGALRNGVVLTQADVDAVATYVDLCLGIRETSADWWIEHRFQLDKIDAELFGTVDFAALSDDKTTLTVVDYKHGAGVLVSPVGNPQLLYYALGVLTTVPAAREVQQLEIIVVQPRAAGESVKRWAVPALDVWDFALELTAGVAATRKPDAPLVPGDHCRFCPAKAAGKCPALEAAADAVVLGDFADAAKLLDDARSAGRLPELLDKAAAAKQWATAVEELARAEALAGRSPSGWKLVHGKTRREFADAVTAVSDAALEFDLAETQVFTREPVSPAVIERLIGKRAAREWLPARLAEPKPAYVLVRESDKRAAVAPPIESEFADAVTETEA